jgi:hypothetical protein
MNPVPIIIVCGLLPAIINDQVTGPHADGNPRLDGRGMGYQNSFKRGD